MAYWTPNLPRYERMNEGTYKKGVHKESHHPKLSGLSDQSTMEDSCRVAGKGEFEKPLDEVLHEDSFRYKWGIKSLHFLLDLAEATGTFSISENSRALLRL